MEVCNDKINHLGDGGKGSGLRPSSRGWGFSSVVERLPSKPKALGSVLSFGKKKKKKDHLHYTRKWRTEWATDPVFKIPRSGQMALKALGEFSPTW